MWVCACRQCVEPAGKDAALIDTYILELKMPDCSSILKNKPLLAFELLISDLELLFSIFYFGQLRPTPCQIVLQRCPEIILKLPFQGVSREAFRFGIRS